jgi:hypothetical protein
MGTSNNDISLRDLQAARIGDFLTDDLAPI